MKLFGYNSFNYIIIYKIKVMSIYIFVHEEIIL